MIDFSYIELTLKGFPSPGIAVIMVLYQQSEVKGWVADLFLFSWVTGWLLTFKHSSKHIYHPLDRSQSVFYFVPQENSQSHSQAGSTTIPSCRDNSQTNFFRAVAPVGLLQLWEQWRADGQRKKVNCTGRIHLFFSLLFIVILWNVIFAFYLFLQSTNL